MRANLVNLYASVDGLREVNSIAPQVVKRHMRDLEKVNARLQTIIGLLTRHEGARDGKPQAAA